jgi:hypothetical protein
MTDMGDDIERGKAYQPLEGFIPNPKLRLLDQVSEVMRFKHYSIRTERTYREWIRRYILSHGKRHPRQMGAAEVSSFLSDLAVRLQTGQAAPSLVRACCKSAVFQARPSFSFLESLDFLANSRTSTRTRTKDERWFSTFATACS